MIMFCWFQVVLPTFILERRSLLELFADCMAHPDVFLRYGRYFYRYSSSFPIIAVINWNWVVVFFPPIYTTFLVSLYNHVLFCAPRQSIVMGWGIYRNHPVCSNMSSKHNSSLMHAEILMTLHNLSIQPEDELKGG